MPRHKIPAKFNKWSIMWDRWFYELKKQNLNATEVCLSYPLSLSEVDRVIVGIDNLNHLNHLIKISQLKQEKLDWSFMKSNDKLLVDPNNWALL
jgi:aryl-alcohol dehydrogenase-like predicted oxidoreductase